MSVFWMLVGALLVLVVESLIDIASKRSQSHRHQWQRGSTSITGWTLLRCECGATELD
jgi:hypothetical protein